MASVPAITRIDHSITRIQKIRLNKLFASATNPLNATFQDLPNTNGQLTFKIENLMSGFCWEFEAEGGMGHFTNDPANDWYINLRDLFPSTLTVVQNIKNDYSITTPAPDSRTYRFVFNPFASIPSKMKLAAGADLDDDDLKVTITYFRVKL